MYMTVHIHVHTEQTAQGHTVQQRGEYTHTAAQICLTCVRIAKGERNQSSGRHRKECMKRSKERVKG
jgi:hypothetical protein